MSTYDKHHTDIMACIGYVCVQWALLEQILLHCIFALTDTDHKSGEIQFGGLDIAPRITMAINLARHHKAPKHITDRLVEIRKSIQDDLKDRRNRVVHGVHSDGGAPNRVSLHMSRWPEPKKNAELSISEMYQIGLDIKETAEDALIVFSDIGDWKFGGHRFESGDS